MHAITFHFLPVMQIWWRFFDSLTLPPSECYRAVHVDELGAEGPLIYLSAAAQGDYQRLLGLHAVTGAIVWDVRQVLNIHQASPHWLKQRIETHTIGQGGLLYHWMMGLELMLRLVSDKLGRVSILSWCLCGADTSAPLQRRRWPPRQTAPLAWRRAHRAR